MGKESKEIVQSRNVLEFITVANELCVFLEENGKYDIIFIYTYLQKVLPLLYLKGTMLPDVFVDDEDANERFVTLEQWEKIYLALLDKTGTTDSFYFIGNDDEFENKPQKGSIAENLADIYQDLKDFLLLYQKNRLAAQQNAVHALRVLFEINWGVKALWAHTAIHNILYGKKKSNNELFSGFSPN
ncbi:MAG TPA: DUF5063 domain-containing protein [Bacteroidales bacterium]|nr:DUF5063 domain-containing protein [Bacteroidales bacterium]